MKKKFHKVLVAVVAMALALGVGATAYAAVNSTTYTKVGDKYAVDTVLSETTVDGIFVQTIERKWIPENRFNKNDPRNPIPCGGSQQPAPSTTDRITQLRNAGNNSLNDLSNYGYSYRWYTNWSETYATDAQVNRSITFQVDESASADRWICTFEQRCTFDSAGHVQVKYYMDGQEYSASSIKSMFKAYGKKR